MPLFAHSGAGTGVDGVQAHTQEFWVVKCLCKISKSVGKEANIQDF